MMGYVSFFLVKTRQLLHKNKPNSLYYKKINRKIFRRSK